jgi:(1->4)-alpha-D-glucan 1-alpha-D-glucosylmutase
MASKQRLRELASRCGIALDYVDVRGHRHEASEPTLRAVLVDMGALDAPDADPESSLRTLDDAVGRRALPPVAVVRAAGPATIRLVLPEAVLHEPLRWVLEEEGGGRRTAVVVPADCPREALYEIGGAVFTAVSLTIEGPMPQGYHRFLLRRSEDAPLAEMPLIAVPEKCYRPEAVRHGGRVWGPAVHLYALRSERNWGVGDFHDLRLLMEQWAEQGAAVVGLNPLHALFLANPNHASPYSPSSRSFFNVLYLDVEAIPDFIECDEARSLVRTPEFQLKLEQLRSADLVDYEGVAAVKRPVLELLYNSFRDRHLAPGSERARAFHAWRSSRGNALTGFALFESLYEQFHAQDPNVVSWRQWPTPYQDPDSPEVAAFLNTHRGAVGFYEYLQWQIDEQVVALGRRSMELRLGVGLYLDVAISVSPDGADVWLHQCAFASQAKLGTPPDAFSLRGQDWGLAPPIPEQLREMGYAPFIAALRQNMRQAGALRIDHIMGLHRLYWVPPGATPADGTYVHSALEEMLGIVALESERNQCMVIGEDLGTVPSAVRTAMRQRDILSYHPMLFEKHRSGAFKRPAQYTPAALVAVTTHDLPTLAGFWSGTDLELRTTLHLFEAEATREAQVVARAQDRARLLIALEQEALLPPTATVNPVSVPELNEELSVAIHVFLARTPSAVMTVQLEDVLLVADQLNLPGTPAETYPSWRRRIPLAVEAWPGDGAFLRLAAAMRSERSPPAHARASLRRRLSIRIPRATYRLQLNRDFTFRDAAAIVPYLARLGVSHVYCSPYLKARSGSTHGYDITDHNALNPEIGSEEEFTRFVDTLHEHGMGQILDVVPNHMGVLGADNQWWLDVLENGPASVFASYFDIDWLPVKPELRGKILLAILSGHYGEVLERGELQLRFDAQAGTFSVSYYQHHLPVAPEEYPRLLRHHVDVLEIRLGPAHPGLLALQSIITAFEHLPGRDVTATERLLERRRDLAFGKERLARLCASHPEILAHVEERVRDYNGSPGDARSFDLLDELLEQQPWRLADWHAASDEINYRRFFDINDLAGLRMEDPRVFDATHQLILKLVAQRQVDGLRIDHPDGLFDPQGYFERLQSRAAVSLGITTVAEERTRQPPDTRAIYVVAEKVLAAYERLPEAWPVHGTTGYDFLNQATGLFIHAPGARRIARFYETHTDQRTDFDHIIYGCKRFVVRYALASELNVLATELNRISEGSRYTRDYTLNRLRQTLTEVVAWLPVYRTYVRDGEVRAADRHYIEWALRTAKKRRAAEDLSVFDFVQSVLLGETLDGADQANEEAIRRFVMHFQQLTGPVMAKGVEDTALYRYVPLAALNEVGGDPRRLGISVAAFHAANRERSRHWPHTMLTTSTHDNKRSEDARLRVAAISEVDREWREHVKRWIRTNRSRRCIVDGEAAPSANDEYLLYQTLIATWPLEEPDEDGYAGFVDRIDAYMAKAAREAKQHTSWMNRIQEYERALSQFVRALLEPSEGNLFLADLVPFARRLARIAMWSSLSQVLLKLTSPGVPDIYQGNESWDFSLVDPDNRRAVNHRLHDHMLDELEAAVRDAGSALSDTVRQLCASAPDGRIKLYVTWRALQFRRSRERLFAEGRYLPLKVSGARAAQVCAYARRRGREVAIVAAPRLHAALLQDARRSSYESSVWGNTRVALGNLPVGDVVVNYMTGERLPVSDGEEGRVVAARSLFATLPLALLYPASTPPTFRLSNLE